MKYMNVEFLRFIFSLMIVYFHFFPHIKGFVGDNEIYALFARNSSNAWIIVEYFLIIAGYFFYRTFYKKEQSWSSFALTKIARLWPVLAFVTFCWVIEHLIFGMKINLYTQFINLFFFQCIGITIGHEFYGVLWFISPFFWVLLFYFYILKNWKKENANLVIALLVYFSLVGNLNYFHGGLGRETIHTFINAGVMRVLAGIGIGYFIGVFHESIKNCVEICKTKLQKVFKFIIVSSIEIYCFVFLLNNGIFHKLSFNNKLIYILIFSILFFCFLMKQGFLSKFLDNKFWGYCGRFSYSIYAMQYVVFFILKKTMWLNHNFVFNHIYLNIFVTLLCCTIIGILTYKFVEVPAGKFLKEKVFFRTKE